MRGNGKEERDARTADSHPFAFTGGECDIKARHASYSLPLGDAERREEALGKTARDKLRERKSALHFFAVSKAPLAHPFPLFIRVQVRKEKKGEVEKRKEKKSRLRLSRYFHGENGRALIRLLREGVGPATMQSRDKPSGGYRIFSEN